MSTQNVVFLKTIAVKAAEQRFSFRIIYFFYLFRDVEVRTDKFLSNLQIYAMDNFRNTFFAPGKIFYMQRYK